MKKYFALCFLLFFGVFAFSLRSVSYGEVVGSYVTETKEFKQELVVNSDGTYMTRLYKAGQVQWQKQGQWTWELSAGLHGIVFANFDGVPGYWSGAGYWFVSPERSLFGKIKINYDTDLYLYFESVPKVSQ